VTDARQYFKYRYDRKALTGILAQTLGERKFGQARTRLCIPSFDGRFGEVYIFKTPHHPDFRKDGFEPMVKVALATAAAPTFFQPLQHGGYTFVDGGVWANNPIMIALVDVLSCFDVPRENVRILSIGCGDDPYVVDRPKIVRGGALAWRDVIYAAMRLQSLNALGQAGLLIGADRIIRIDAPASEEKIRMDDWTRASAELPGAANGALEAIGDRVASIFLKTAAEPYDPNPAWYEEVLSR
jgi:patatin-like phospholipase/acyl hydrolase